ncbi:MAG: GldG family protein [Anaerolineales bacterium]
MKPEEYRRFAPVGLIVFGLALLVSFGLYVVQQEWNRPLQISLAVAVIGLAAFMFLDPERTRRMLSGRQARYGSNALVLSLAFTGILIVVNYLIYQNAQDWNLRWDLTEDKEHTLAPETLDALAALPEPVVAKAFYTSLNPSGASNARELLDDYTFYAGGMFDYEIIDPDEEPLAATQFNVTRDGTVVLLMGENDEQVTVVNEREFTGALIRLMNPGDQKIYFLTGHGERSYEGSDDGSLQQVTSSLKQRNYVIDSLNILATNEVPDDAVSIVVAFPQFPVSEEEAASLASYLDGGGSLIVMYEPVPLTQFGDAEEPLTAYLAESWGITLGNDIIVDLSSNQPFTAVANQYADHLIIQKIQGLVTLFPGARSVQVTGKIDNVKPVEFIWTANQSWAETDFAALAASEIAPDEGEDIIGPVPIAVVAENSVTGGRVVVFGDSDFASNASYDLYGNGDLFVNAIDWAAGQEDIISLTPKDKTQRLLIPPQRYVMGLVLLGSVFVLPGLTLLSGIIVWIRRRRRA